MICIRHGIGDLFAVPFSAPVPSPSEVASVGETVEEQESPFNLEVLKSTLVVKWTSQ